ncbi:caspase family protein, partial [Ramlibacter sp. MAHUQ-53]|uniref:caspase family protein n=1 Tax=unclassified Ramlibacter TaxID=2617605 RepID=UPI00363054C2
MQARVPAARLRPVTRAALALLAGAGLAIPVPAQNAPGAGADRNLVIALPAPPAPVVAPSAARRVALVIGNASYKDAPLTNPVNDARAIAQALRDSGFAVTLRENADMKEMLAAVRGFGDELRKGGVGVFYFAGHGMQIKGRNYLIPVGGSIEREDEVAYSAVDAQAVLDKMDAAGNGTNLLILDACRNNPFARSFRSAQQGLAQMDAPVGTLVAFATSPGSVASDGQGGNGLYTQHLLQAMREPGAKVEDVFKRVRANVRRDSQGKQVPWESTSLEGDFYFLTPKPAAAPESGDAALEKAMWALVKESRQALEIKAFLSRFPSGAFAKEAGARLAALEEGARRTAADAQAAAAKAPAAPAPAPAPAP